MLNKSLTLLGALALSAAAIAQANLGTVSNTQGLVTMSDGTTFATATAGSPVTDGMRFLTSTGGTVTLQLQNGCTINLQANQALTVQQSMSCAQLNAAIVNVVPAGGGTFAGGGLPGTTLAALGMGVGILAIQNSNLSGQ